MDLSQWRWDAWQQYAPPAPPFMFLTPSRKIMVSEGLGHRRNMFLMWVRLDNYRSKSPRKWKTGPTQFLNGGMTDWVIKKNMCLKMTENWWSIRSFMVTPPKPSANIIRNYHMCPCVAWNMLWQLTHSHTFFNHKPKFTDSLNHLAEDPCVLS